MKPTRERMLYSNHLALYKITPGTTSIKVTLSIVDDPPATIAFCCVLGALHKPTPELPHVVVECKTIEFTDTNTCYSFEIPITDYSDKYHSIVMSYETIESCWRRPFAIKASIYETN
jgi:hypothetical protein